jgi:hypothetical protein
VRIRLEISDLLFGSAKSVARARGVSLDQFVAEALREKVNSIPAAGPKPWMKHLGKLKRLPKETEQIEKRIQDAFEHIDAEE